jgi:hypothetical protein
MATGRAARTIVANRDLGSSAVSGRHVLTQTHSFHHRVLRSQGGPDTPDNLLLVSGTGTTGEHGWIHANVAHARAAGLIVPSWSTPDDWPVYRRDPFGSRWGWFWQLDDGQLTELTPHEEARHRAALGEPLVAIALLAYRRLVTRERAGA